MKSYFHQRDYHRLVERALDSGATVKNRNTIEWDIAAKCSSPVHRELSSTDVATARLKGTPMEPVGVSRSYLHTTELAVRCRKCPPCLRYRAFVWRSRAINEIKVAPRTWMATLTLAPDAQVQALNRARYRLHKQRLDFDALAPDERFAEIVRDISPDLTRFFKRVRKNSAVPMRYLLVTERHKSGLPHFHALLHEVDVFGPLRYALLKEQWRLGFSTFKLVDGPNAAYYVAKYLSKSIVTRVRASQGYGHPIVDPS